jgi:hypothetical protein
VREYKKYFVMLLLACVGLAGVLGYLLLTSFQDFVSENHVPIRTANGNLYSKNTPVGSSSTPRSLQELLEWARQDPYGAIEWASWQKMGEERESVLETACYKMAEKNPKEAVREAEKSKLTQYAVFENLVQQWAQKDISAAYYWVIARPSSEQKNELLERIGLVWAASEPQSAAQFVIQAIPPGSQQTEAAIAVLHQWGQRDLVAAKAWVQQFPEGEVRTRALDELIGIEGYRMAVRSH